MNSHLQSVLNFIQRSQALRDEDKISLLKAVNDADKELAITAFKLDRTEKVKRTTAILLEETIEELEQKRKAVEAQNRDLEIESSLERVRTVVMAMRKPDDMLDVCKIISTQLQLLNVDNIRNIQTAIFYEEKNSYLNYEYFSVHDKTFITEVEYNLQPDVKTFVNQMQQDPEAFFTTSFEGDKLKEWVEYQKKVGQFVDPKLQEATSVHYYFYSIGLGAMGISTYVPLSEERVTVFKRFRNVFDLAYRRLMDIEQALAQAREAKIEAALERVRAKAMAMHKSDDLKVAVATVFEELDKLDLGLIRCGIAILDKEKPRGDIWITIKSDRGNTIQVSGDEPLDIHPLLKGAYDAWLKQEDFSYVLQNDDLISYYQAITKTNFQLPVSATFNIEKKDQQQHYFNAVFQDGSLFAFLDTAFTDEAKMVMKRFANVFNLTYKRFLDLQKAEAQAREAQIELGLERVRARAMAMQNSDELAQLVATLFEELVKLDLILSRCIIWIFDTDTLASRVWMANSEDKKTAKSYFIKRLDHPYYEAIIKGWKDRSPKWVYDLYGSDKKSIDDLLLNETELSQLPEVVKAGILSSGHTIVSGSFNNFGLIEASGPVPHSDEQLEIIYRFSKVFDLTYTRFNDLKLAEAQAREAQIETALEKVRSRTLAMQKSDELAETAAVVFNQLIGLGIAPNRLYIGIVKDESGEIEYWITDEDGSKVSQQFTGNANRNESVLKIFTGWKAKQKSLTIDMQGEELKNYFHYLADELNVPFKGGLSQKRRVQTIAYFGKGFIGIASPDEQPEETTKLLERFAAVFNLTITRFNDLKIAEAHAEQAELDLLKFKEEKKRTEDALAELQVTQKQLIQSEKMASLGELTAGIAHEIQNPLNFVNNFSEVSTELLDEMITELGNGNKEDAIAIADDVKQNLEKILHHGKRADGIVKGMLQHSRSSSAVKEPTDINKLADEYLRLAYHGLRAKDKSFNATMKTDFDKSIGKINIIPQDIGRVILNLITNAFYAVTEKKKQNETGYEPTVTVSTKKVTGAIEIKVKDNGNGIPQKVLDKIFQPFFTTKPTGQGTGLGLSLSYDIVTAHGGEIKVESREGEGSEFIIHLPNH